MSIEHPNPSRWWKHRRRMAYASFIWAVLQTFMWIGLELWAPGFISGAATVIGWSYGTASTIIIGYFGNTAVETYRNRPQTPRAPSQSPSDGPWNQGGV